MADKTQRHVEHALYVGYDAECGELSFIEHHRQLQPGRFLNIVMYISLSSRRVIRKLNQLIEWRGQPIKKRVDNCLEYIALAMAQWEY